LFVSALQSDFTSSPGGVDKIKPKIKSLYRIHGLKEKGKNIVVQHLFLVFELFFC